MFRIRVLSLLFLAFSLGGPALAQDAEPEPPVPPVVRANQDAPAISGDRLNVVVVGERDLTRAYTVDLEGSIYVPLLGKVPVKGLFPAQIREELTKRLARFIRDPQISVEFLERALITVGVTGAVARPGSVALMKGSRLLDGLSQAGGITMEADIENLALQRRGAASATVFKYPDLFKDPKLNVELKEGDTLYIPRLPVHTVHVLGAVVRPGDVVRNETVTLLQAIEAAGGLTPDAERARIQVLRKGEEEARELRLDDVLSGKTPNLVLRDGDTLTVAAVPKIPVKVFGLVTKPGESLMKEGTTVLEAITASGGFAADADRRAILVSSLDGQVKRYNLFEVNSQDGFTVLRPGDRVFVPQEAPRRFAVAGGVNEPGLFPFPPDLQQKIFLTDAIAQAKGLSDRAKKKTVVLVRKNPAGGDPLMHPVDFEALLKTKDPRLNLEIQPGDVVYVDVEPAPKDRRPSVFERILGIVGAFAGF